MIREPDFTLSELCLHFLRVPLLKQTGISAEPKIETGQHRQNRHKGQRVSDQFPVASHRQIGKEKQRPDLDADAKRQARSAENRPLSLEKQRDCRERKDEELRIPIPKFFDEVRRNEQKGNNEGPRPCSRGL